MSPKLGIFLRALSILIRFVAPLAVLGLSNQEELGRYYLFLSVAGFVLFALTFESGLYFAKKFHRLSDTLKINEGLFRICIAQTMFVAVFFAPVILIFLFSVKIYSFSIFLTVLLYLYSEAISNEFGRFLTNINKVYWVTIRDLLRSSIFLTAAVSSLLTFSSIITWQYFLTYAVLNFILILAEVRRQAGSSSRSFFYKKLNGRYLVRVFFAVISGSAGVISQSWILFIYPLLERLLIEKTIGLIAVGGYAFINSIFQATASIFFLPDIAKLRTQIIQKLNQKESIEFKLNGLGGFVFRVLVLGLVIILCLWLYNSINLGLVIFDKFHVPLEYGVAALIGVIASNVINIVSPHYSRNPFILKSALITCGIYLLTFIVYVSAHFFLKAGPIMLFAILSLGFFSQIMARRNYF